MAEPEYKQLEYAEALNMLRFHLELRSKALNFTLVTNGALLTVVLSYLQNPYPKAILSFFGLVICIVFFALTQRSMFLVDTYAEYCRDLEKEMGIGLITKTSGIHLETGLKARVYFKVIYLILVGLWLFVALVSVIR